MDNGDATLIDIPNSRLLLRSLQTQEEFAVSGEMTVGRDKASDIHLNDISISRHHAKVTAIAGALIVEDLNSTNGTSVNGEKISTPQQLDVGDELRFHKHAFRVATHGASDDEATLFAAAPAAVEPKVEVEAALAELALPHADDVDGDAADEESRPRPDRTQTISPQKLKSLAQRAAMAKNPVTAGSGARLVILTAPLRGKIISLPEDVSPGTSVNIGRGGHSNKLNIMLEDKTVSQDHAKLRLTPHGWTITASDAKNGLIINGQQTTRATLQHQDTLTLGRIELAFLTDENDEAVDASARAHVVEKKPKRRGMGKVIMILIVIAAVLLGALFALPIVE